MSNYKFFKKKKDELKVFMKKKENTKSEKVSVVNENEKDKKLTITQYEVLKEFEKDKNKFSLVEIDLKTGFTHQIRVCMKYLKSPYFSR